MQNPYPANPDPSICVQAKLLAASRFQSICTAITAVCMVVLLVGGLLAAPKILSLMQRMETLSEEAEVLLMQMENVTASLSEIDMVSMVEDVDSLVQVSQQGVEEAIDKISALDIENLNTAISNLSDVIEPLSNFFRALRR